MDEAEQLCDRLVIMDNGKIADMGSPRELIERHTRREVVELRFTAAGREMGEISVLDTFPQVEVLPDRLLVSTDNGDEVLARISERAIQAESTLVRRSTLEDVFLRLTGRSLID